MKGIRDYLRIGLLVGLAVFLVGHFATKESIGSGGGALFTLFWVLAGAVIGLGVALALGRQARARPEAETGAQRMVTGETKPSMPTLTKFYAVSRAPSSSEFRALMVDAPAIPGLPPSNRLKLIVERCDGYKAIQLETDDPPLSLPVMTLAEHLARAATRHAPVDSVEPVAFTLTYLFSEGPLDEAGRSPFGWTFRFVNGLKGIQCEAVVTDESCLLLYTTAVSFPKMAVSSWAEPQRALEIAREAFPDLADVELQLRVEFPHDYQLVAKPLWVCPIDARRKRVIGPELLPPPETVIGSKRSGEEADAGSDDEKLLDSISALVERLNDDLSFRDEMTGTGTSRGKRRAVAGQLFERLGPGSVAELETAIVERSTQNYAVAHGLLLVLSRMPSNLATASLHRLAESLEGEHRGIAQTLFDKRRHDDLGVGVDPVADLEFEEVRRLLGRAESQRLALRSTYDPEGELLGPLEQAGLTMARVRCLSGDTELFLSAYLVTSDRRSEALIRSSPLPVPCHLLHVVGPDSGVLADLVKVSNAYYSREEILEDVLSHRPTDIHRAALYVAVLRMDEPEIFDALVEGIARNHTNVELRRACLVALAAQSHEGVIPYLRSIDDAELADLSRRLLQRIESRQDTGEAATTG